MTANKRILLTFAKTLFLVIPLLLAWMFGLDWGFNKFSHEYGISIPVWLGSLITLSGIYLIVIKIIGADLMQMKKDYELKKSQKGID
jgi:hypothetical protein